VDISSPQSQRNPVAKKNRERKGKNRKIEGGGGIGGRKDFKEYRVHGKVNNLVSGTHQLYAAKERKGNRKRSG
jgi:hypothetical protein